jgi:protein SCO1
MNLTRPARSAILISAALLACAATAAFGQPQSGGILADVGFDQNLGADLPLELPFRDEAGREIRLAELFGKRPVILVPVYYGCPLLCGQVLSGLTRSLRPLAQAAGNDFDVVVFSINPDEQPALARSNKTAYLERYGRPETASGWHFLTGTESSIRALTGAIGFRYTYSPQTKLYAHAAGVVVVTPGGRVARYFYGIDYPAKEIGQEVTRAGAGGIGSRIGRLLLFCYDYDAATGRYTLAILRLIRILGTATALALAGFVLLLIRRESRQQRSPEAPFFGPEDSGQPAVNP